MVLSSFSAGESASTFHKFENDFGRSRNCNDYSRIRFTRCMWRAEFRPPLRDLVPGIDQRHADYRASVPDPES